MLFGELPGLGGGGGDDCSRQDTCKGSYGISSVEADISLVSMMKIIRRGKSNRN